MSDILVFIESQRLTLKTTECPDEKQYIQSRPIKMRATLLYLAIHWTEFKMLLRAIDIVSVFRPFWTPPPPLHA